MRERLIIASIVPLLIAIGMWGQYQLSPDNLTEHFSRSLYQVISLFFLEGEWTLELQQVPLAINLVRFVAPLVAIASFILVFAAATRTSLSNYGVRYYRDHTVVVGMGQKCWQFLRSCENKRSIVAVERQPDNRLIERAREMGVKVLVGDIFEEGMFDRIGLDNASTLIAFTDNDGSNVELAIKARNRVRANHGNGSPLKINIHLNEIGLAKQLEGYPKFFADYSIAEMSFFSIYDLSARLLLRDYPPEIFADVAGQDRVHLCLFGFSKMAEKLAIEAALLCHYANESRLRLTIFDEDAVHKARVLRSEYPQLSKICDYRFHDMPAFSASTLDDALGQDLSSVTQHVVCMGTDEENLNVALLLRSAVLERRGCNAPILVRMQHSSGLAQLLESNTGEPEIPDGLYPFGMLDHVLQADNILTSQLDSLAHTIHDMYLEQQANGDPRTHKALQGWDELPQWERKQNLLKADHWPVRLRAIRCTVTDKPAPGPSLTEHEAELQARMEHGRYTSQKVFDGWMLGEERLEDARINPYLVPWVDLPVAQRDIETREAQAQPAYFAERGERHIQRNYVIGVTGHRPHKLDTSDKALEARIVAALEGLRDAQPDHHFVVLSSLAEGADRLVAKLAMRVLDATLEVPMPLPFDLYASDFVGEESIEEFKQLVGKARIYYELPMRFGNVRELAVREGNTTNEARNRQYALAGAYVIQRCDCLFAVYDGTTHNGTGGTSQIVNWYQSGDIEPEYRYPNDYFLPPRKDPLVLIAP